MPFPEQEKGPKKVSRREALEIFSLTVAQIMTTAVGAVSFVSSIGALQQPCAAEEISDQEACERARNFRAGFYLFLAGAGIIGALTISTARRALENSQEINK